MEASFLIGSLCVAALLFLALGLLFGLLSPLFCFVFVCLFFFFFVFFCVFFFGGGGGGRKHKGGVGGHMPRNQD